MERLSHRTFQGPDSAAVLLPPVALDADIHIVHPGRPHWKAAEAALIRDVRPYQKMKLRLLDRAPIPPSPISALRSADRSSPTS